MTNENLGRDPKAFEAFYKRHVKRVTGFVARRVTDPHLVDDLTTEVFLAAIEGADSFRPAQGTESAWLIGIARNVLASERRTAARRVDKALRHAGRRPLDADDISRLEEQIDAERAAGELLTAVSALAPGLRAVIELVDIDGLTVTEAATALRIPPVTARVRLHRARQQLKAVSIRPQTDFEFVKETT